MDSTQHIRSGNTAETILPMLREVLKAKLFTVTGIAKPIFKDTLKNGTLDPIAAIAVLYINNKPVAWTVKTTNDWRTGYHDTLPRTTNEIWWRFTSPAYRNSGFCTLLKSALTKF